MKPITVENVVVVASRLSMSSAKAPRAAAGDVREEELFIDVLPVGRLIMSSLCAYKAA